jgi:hypothetical protein
LNALNTGIVSHIDTILQGDQADLLEVALECVQALLTASEDMERENKTADETPIYQQLLGIEITQRLENLQNHPNPEIYKLAAKIITSFFDCETDNLI